MKKVFLSILLSVCIYASNIELEHKIYESIFIELKPQALVYTDIPIPSLTLHSLQYTLTKDCSKSDIIIISSDTPLPLECQTKMIFGTRYQHLKLDSVLGAFFWQKGRPNMMFVKKRLEKLDIHLSKSFRKYQH